MKWTGLAVAVLVVLAGEGVASGAQRADLRITRVTAKPMTAAPGGTVRVKDVVRNAGRGRAKSVQVAYYLSRNAKYDRRDRAVSGRRKVKALRPRKTSRGARSVTVPTSVGSGAYRLVACVDPGRRIKERNERNNCRAAAGRFTVVLPSPGGLTPLPFVLPPAAPAPQPAPPPSPAPGPSGGAAFPLTPDPLTVTDTLETARRATASMGAVESTLTATAANGTKYTLAMPQGALRSAVDVTMTPVAAIGGLPLSQGLIGAVELKPHGLILQKPATLTIEPPGGTSTDGATAFLYHQGGEDFHLYPHANGLSLSLLHFSTPGFGRGTAADVANVANHPPARPGAQLEQSSALGDPAGHMASYYDGVVRNQLVESQNARTGMAQSIEHALAWLRQLQLLGLGEDEAFAERVRDLEQRIEILRQILLEEAIKACKNHELEAVATLWSLARQHAIETGEEENPMVDEAKKCLNFEARIDSTITEERSHGTPGVSVSWGSASGSWQALGTVPIDWLGFTMNAPLPLGGFEYSSDTTSHCAEPGETTTLRTVHAGQAEAGEVTALLVMDLNPREPAPEGQPAPDPPQDALTLMFNSGPSERYRSWSEGCAGTSADSFATNTLWRSHFTAFHDNSSVLKLPIQRSRHPVEVIHTELFAGTRPVGNGTVSENTKIELWHTPKN